MNQQALIHALRHPDAQTRYHAARVCQMVDETAALHDLMELYRVETVATVKDAMLQAGRALNERKQQGYDTLDAIFDHFKINAEIAASDTPDEARLMKQVQEQAHLQMLKEQQNAMNTRAATNAGMLLGATLLGGATGAMMAASSMMSNPATDVLSSNIKATTFEAVTRVPPTAPTNTECKVQMRRLREDSDPAKRRNAAIDLGNLNNPASLPALATAYLSDNNPEVRKTAQRAGKQIYWNCIYWELSRNGVLDKEVQRRTALLRASAPTLTAPPSDSQRTTTTMEMNRATTTSEQLAAAQSPDDIEAILRKAEERRQKRGKNV